MMEQLQVTWKYIASFFKNDWKARDYPLRIHDQKKDLDLNIDNGYLAKYAAQIINWPVKVGLGETPEEAVADLDRALEKFKRKFGYLYRPGVHVPIEIASSAGIDAHLETKNRFLVEVIEYGLETPIFISDESSLFDFDGLVEGVDLIERVEEVFGVDISDIPDGNMVKIFEKIDGSA